MKNLVYFFNLKRPIYNDEASKCVRAFVILSGVRHERSRRIHNVAVSSNVRSGFKAMDSSTSFVPHSAQNDKGACWTAHQASKTLTSRRLRIIPLALIAALALGGCGKKSNPDAPFTTGNATDANSASTNATDTNAPATNATGNAAPADASATDNNGAPIVKLASATLGAIDATLPATGTLMAFPNRETKITPATAGTLQICRFSWAKKSRAAMFWRSFRRRRCKVKSRKRKRRCNKVKSPFNRRRPARLGRKPKARPAFCKRKRRFRKRKPACRAIKPR